MQRSVILNAPLIIALVLSFLPQGQAQQGGTQEAVDLSGKYRTNDGDEVLIKQTGQTLTATFLSKSDCPGGGTRDFYLQGTLSGKSLTGTMQRCTRSQRLLQDCHLKDPYSAKIIETTVDQNTIKGKYVPDYITYDTKDGHYVNCAIKTGGGTPTEFTLTRECAIPINFRQTGASDAGNGVLYFEYAWESSTGNLADLSECLLGENVEYNSSDLPFPSPPFPSDFNPPNPTTKNVSASDGAGHDNHSTGTLVSPYKAATVTASQIYRYSCPCHSNGHWETLMGPHPIVRSVSQNSNHSWRFTITKTGASATINPLP